MFNSTVLTQRYICCVVRKKDQLLGQFWVTSPLCMKNLGLCCFKSDNPQLLWSFHFPHTFPVLECTDFTALAATAPQRAIPTHLKAVWQRSRRHKPHLSIKMLRTWVRRWSLCRQRVYCCCSMFLTDTELHHFSSPFSPSSPSQLFSLIPKSPTHKLIAPFSLIVSLTHIYVCIQMHREYLMNIFCYLCIYDFKADCSAMSNH